METTGNLGFPTGNPVETTGNLGLPDRKPRGNHWKPGVARQETTWKPLETWGCQEGNHRETRSKLDGKYRFPLRKPYVNYLLTMAVTLNVYKYCMEMTIFWKAKLDILSLSLVYSLDRTAHIFCYIVKYRYVKP